MKRERKKTQDASDIHPPEAWELRIGDDKDTVMSGTFISPVWTGPDVFTTHASCATQVAWGIKGGGCRVENGNLIGVKRACVAWTIIVGMDFGMEEGTDEMGELGDSKFSCEVGDSFCPVTF